MYVNNNDDKFPFPRYQQSYATPSDEDNPTWLDINSYHINQLGGDDVWFNALPKYVGSKPLYEWALGANKALFNATGNRNMFICPTAYAQGIDPTDKDPNHGFMEVGQSPLFSYGMNSKAVANENMSAYVPYAKMSAVAHPSAFALFSDTRNRSAESPYYATPGNSSPNSPPANWLDLATPQSYTTRFSARHNKGGCITFSDGHSAYFFYDDVVADGIKDPSVIPGHDPGNPDIDWDENGQRVP